MGSHKHLLAIVIVVYRTNIETTSHDRMSTALSKDFSATSQDEGVMPSINPKRRNRIAAFEENGRRKSALNKSPLSLFKTVLLFSMIMCTAVCCTVFKLMQSVNTSANKVGSQINDIAKAGSISAGTREIFPVDRSVLDKLEYLHRASGDLHELDVLSWNGHWPPLVTRLPEPKSSSKKVASYADIMEFCNLQSMSQNSCRFLLPYRIAEQESKARLHFSQLIFLAQALNRTLVLPNVGKGRMGLCFGWDFEVYYDLSSLEDQGIHFARLGVLKGWTDLRTSRRISTSGQLLLLGEKQPEMVFSRSSTDFEVQVINDVANIDTGCFGSRFQNLDMTRHRAVSLNVIYSRKTRAMNMAQRLVEVMQNIIKGSQLITPDTITAKPTQKSPDILVLSWDLRHPVFPSLGFDLRYSPQLVDLARDLSPSGPYLAIHWRVETILPDILPQCAYALVDTLTSVLHEPSLAGDIKSVWLASDMPFAPLLNAVSKSGTLKELTSFHKEAAEIVHSAFQAGGELVNWSLQTLEQSLGPHYSNGYYAEWLGDFGTQGILDKIIAAQATLFIGGTKKCSRVR
ncbi:hypothetical protein AX15_000555 [Amanita polypyramis BW_CC]|nr:hypothetical protein AX15_000555 [Amanita polypyramis BW_CC]